MDHLENITRGRGFKQSAQILPFVGGGRPGFANPQRGRTQILLIFIGDNAQILLAQIEGIHPPSSIFFSK